MQAVIYEEYGPPSNLYLREVEKPIPKNDQVLIRVKAVSINDWDWGLLQGKPFVNRILSGFSKPKHQILGSDISGTVEALGSSVENFNIGDEVFGDLSTTWGGFAEYVCAPEKSLTIKPIFISFEQAAAMPQAGLLALQSLNYVGQIKQDQDVLINGAAGGGGSFAIQIAKAAGANVTGVDHGSKFSAMRSLGADHVIDYTQENFTCLSKQYDLIIDVKTQHSPKHYLRVLKPNGMYVTVGGDLNKVFQLPFYNLISKHTDKKYLRVLFHQLNKGMEELISLVEQGKIVPLIDKVYSLENTAEAMRQFGLSHQCGKIVIKVS